MSSDHLENILHPAADRFLIRLGSRVRNRLTFQLRAEQHQEGSQPRKSPSTWLDSVTHLAHPGFRGATKSPINDLSRALPRLRTLWTNSKKPRYSGSRSCEIPRC